MENNIIRKLIHLEVNGKRSQFWLVINQQNVWRHSLLGSESPVGSIGRPSFSSLSKRADLGSNCIFDAALLTKFVWYRSVKVAASACKEGRAEEM